VTGWAYVAWRAAVEVEADKAVLVVVAENVFSDLVIVASHGWVLE
jgi:hypothetical protein